jgi:uncharacterized membrane protein YhaH (DUF805 family)
MRESRSREKVGLAIYCAGFAVGLFLAAIAVWGGVEAAMFDPSLTAEQRLRSLRCPLLATEHEDVSVTATFANPSDRLLQIPIRTRISHGRVTIIREVAIDLALEPGESETLAWRVDSDDLVFGRFILVRVFAVRSPPLPSRGGSCGIMVLDVPYVTGNQILVVSLLFSLAAMAAGGWLWLTSVRPLDDRNRREARIMALLAVIVLVTLAAAYFGYAAVGVLALIFMFILLGSLLENYLAGRGRR